MVPGSELQSSHWSVTAGKFRAVKPRRGSNDAEQDATHIVVSESELVHQVPPNPDDPYHLSVPVKSESWELTGTEDGDEWRGRDDRGKT